MIIYKAQNKINGKTYIGQTAYPLERRISDHRSAKHGAFPAALKKYGADNFDFEIIAWCDKKQNLDFLERFYIQFLNSKAPNGYNLTDGGDGLTNPTIQTREKISQKLKSGYKNGLIIHPTAGKRRPWLGDMNRQRCLGKVLSDETKNKLSEALKGRPKPDGFGMKLRKPKPLNSRYKESFNREEIRAHRSFLQSGERNSMYGKECSEDAKRKIGQKAKERFRSGQLPWNKGKKGLQVAWNKGLKVRTKEKEKEKIN